MKKKVYKKFSYLTNSINKKKKILFLGYNEKQTRIINELIKNECMVDHTNDKISNELDYDIIISFGYRHIIKKNIIKDISCPIFNLHISYLPYNRGSYPNFWSFYDNTPSGVTIHLVDEGIDTGPIVYQKYVKFLKSETTFLQTYSRLIEEVEDLFLKNLNNILNNNWVPIRQIGKGSFHKKSDLPKNFSGWNSNIFDELKRLEREGLKYD